MISSSGGELGGRLEQEHAERAWDLIDTAARGEVTPHEMEFGLKQHPYLAERLDLGAERSVKRAVAFLLELSGSRSFIFKEAFVAWLDVFVCVRVCAVMSAT